MPEERLNGAFGFMSEEDPFSGHVVIRRAEHSGPGCDYRLWTTVKVPRGRSVARHSDILKDRVGAAKYNIMPARAVFVLGVGHVRRRTIRPGSRTELPAEVMYPEQAELSDDDWRVLQILQREFEPEEIGPDIWRNRCRQAHLPLEQFYATAESLAERKLLGRFSTFLRHNAEPKGGPAITPFSALVQWAVPPGREVEAGREIGRHEILTHCYWRDAGPEFGYLNIMGMIHGDSRDAVIEHKLAIDTHVEEHDIPILYSNVLWSERADIRPSAIGEDGYVEWLARMGLS
jgi:hypothetical protein